MWYVANDFGNRRFSSQPLGCELQQYMFGFPSSDPVLNNTVFIRSRFINRNIPNPQNPNAGLWKNAYFAIFNDSDVGDPGDDVVGCDTLNGLAYTYNGLPIDAIYGSPPPAVGYVFLSGRRGSSPISPSAHVRFEGGGSPIGDPETGRPDHLYNFMRGLDKNGNPVSNTVPGSRFMFPGDPETGQGIIETELRDKRSLLVFGPVDVPVGDTVEVTYAVTIAQGNSNLNSVTVLKQQADSIRSFFLSTPRDPSSVKQPTEYALMQNYPNPFNPTTIIRYQLPTASVVQLEVFDVLGKKVASLVNSKQAAGDYSVLFDASSLSSGVYFYRLQASQFVQTKKMLLVK